MNVELQSKDKVILRTMKAAPDQWGTPITRDFSGVEKLRKLRGVKTFDDFPESTKAVYMEAARCFPGWQVWACGSRVRGDYREKNDYFFVNIAREMAGMKMKDESDFDFLVAPDAVQVGELPENTERVRCRIPESELIEIPVYYGLELEQTA